MKPCGECRICCKVFPVPVLKKAAGVWCQFVCTTGCSVHGAALPAICREYDCFWREHELPDALRPDRLGIVITESGTLSIGFNFLPVLILHPVEPESLERVDVEELLSRLLADGFVVVIIQNANATIRFDPAFHPQVTAEQIETALRQQFADDAEELKRLGAAPPDYNPLRESHD